MTPTFYAHVNRHILTITAITPDTIKSEDIVCVPIELSLALKFLGGEESPNDWEAILNGNEYLIKKIDKAKFFLSRVATLPIQLADHDLSGQADVFITSKNNKLCFKYNKTVISRLDIPITIYITRFDDVTDLKFTMSLSHTKLTELFGSADVSIWADEILVDIGQVSDLSVYVNRSSVKITTSFNNETID